MDDEAVFEAERAHLFAVAYRMLGSAAEADDVVQEAFLRWQNRGAIADSPHAFLTTIVVRLCLDERKSARVRRETYVGPWLPEPIVAAPESDPSRPDARAEMAESIQMAFLVLLETLSPLERAAFLLREVFEHPFADVARILDTTEAACRQLVARARAHVDAGKPRFQASDAKKQELLAAFVGACSSGDLGGLASLLADDVVARTDGGGRVSAARKPIHGRDAVSRFLVGITKKGLDDAVVVEPRFLNGELAFVLIDAERRVTHAIGIGVSGEKIRDVWIVANPEKLERLG